MSVEATTEETVTETPVADETVVEPEVVASETEGDKKKDTESEDPKAKRLASRFAEIARRDRQAKEREKAIEKRAKDLEAREKRIEARLKAAAGGDPDAVIEFFSEHGLDYDAWITSMATRNLPKDPIQQLESRVADFEAKRKRDEDEAKARAERTREAELESVNTQLAEQLAKFVQRPEFELVSQEDPKELVQAVVSIATKHLQESPDAEPLTTTEILTMIEDRLERHLEKYTKLDKIKKKVAPQQAASTAKPEAKGREADGPRTLTNKMAASEPDPDDDEDLVARDLRLRRKYGLG